MRGCYRNPRGITIPIRGFFTGKPRNPSRYRELEKGGIILRRKDDEVKKEVVYRELKFEVLHREAGTLLPFYVKEDYEALLELQEQASSMGLKATRFTDEQIASMRAPFGEVEGWEIPDFDSLLLGGHEFLRSENDPSLWKTKERFVWHGVFRQLSSAYPELLFRVWVYPTYQSCPVIEYHKDGKHYEARVRATYTPAEFSEEAWEILGTIPSQVPMKMLRFD